jgi:hypothetical protein
MDENIYECLEFDVKTHGHGTYEHKKGTTNFDELFEDKMYVKRV